MDTSLYALFLSCDLQDGGQTQWRNIFHDLIDTASFAHNLRDVSMRHIEHHYRSASRTLLNEMKVGILIVGQVGIYMRYFDLKQVRPFSRHVQHSASTRHSCRLYYITRPPCRLSYLCEKGHLFSRRIQSACGHGW